MSEANFFLFWIYLMDLHNLTIAGLSRVEPDPREEYRRSIIKTNNMDLSMLKKTKECEAQEEEKSEESDLQVNTVACVEAGSNEVDEAAELLKNLDVNNFQCPICGKPYKKEGYLTSHMLKHNDIQKSTETKQSLFCEMCAHPCGSKLALEKHMKTKHLTCSICKATYPSAIEANLCRSRHTTCSICGFDAKFPSKLTRHMESHK